MSDTNQAVVSLKMARSLKFWIKNLDGFYYVVKTKALISFAVTAKLICVFFFLICKKPVFSRRGTCITGGNLLETTF